MPKPTTSITPDNRLERWKKLWATPKKLDAESTEIAFDEFADAVVPGHMHKLFLKSFGQPRAHFGNRFFKDGSVYHNWDTKLSSLGAAGATHVEVVVIYASTEKMEAHALRGEPRRTLRDIIIDDWQAALAIARTPSSNLYIFIEPKMRGCIVKAVSTGTSPEPEGPDDLGEPQILEIPDELPAED